MAANVRYIVRDVESGATGVRRIGFQAPKFPEDRLSASGIVLAARLENMESGAPVGQFVIGPDDDERMAGVDVLQIGIGAIGRVAHAVVAEADICSCGILQCEVRGHVARVESFNHNILLVFMGVMSA